VSAILGEEKLRDANAATALRECVRVFTTYSVGRRNSDSAPGDSRLPQ
jgi:hypothetical protein